MNSRKYRSKKPAGIIRLFLTATLMVLTGSLVGADQFRVGRLSVDHPWAMPLPPVSPNGAVYMVISNYNEVAVRLVGGITPVAKRVEIHAPVHKDGQMQMHRLADGLEIPGGEVVEFAPGKLHLMLIGLNQPLVEGETFPVTLDFEQAGSVDLVIRIEQGM